MAQPLDELPGVRSPPDLCYLEHFPFVLNRGGFPKSCQCASLTALIRFGGGNNAEAVFDGLA
jgi:hypothetical protein